MARAGLWEEFARKPRIQRSDQYGGLVAPRLPLGDGGGGVGLDIAAFGHSGADLISAALMVYSRSLHAYA